MTRASLLLTLAFTSCGATCGPPPPTSETCELPPGAPRPTVTNIEIGHTADGTFIPIEAGAVVPLVLGGQGANMVVAALRITGSGLSSCIAQETRLEDAAGDLMSSEAAPVRTRALSSTVVTTGDILLPWYGPFGESATLRSTIAGQSASVTFWINVMPEIDAAAPSDAPPDA